MSPAPPVAAPVFLVGAPASGSQLLLASLSWATGVWRPRTEGAFLGAAHEAADGDGEDARQPVAEQAEAFGPATVAALLGALVDREGHAASPDATGVAVAAGLRVSLSIPFLAAAFPEARFVLTVRGAGAAVPDWQRAGAPPGDDAEPQWAYLRDRISADLQAVPSERWRIADHARLVADPRGELRALCVWLGITYDQALLGPFEDRRRAESTAPQVAGPSASAPPPAPAPASPFTSVSTPSLPAALAALGSSLLISTYQTGKLILARAQDGGLNTHFRDFDKPMGIALGPGRFSLGTRTEVWDLRDMPQVAPKLEPAGTHDACYVPRNRHVTGDIAVHEMGFAGGELWVVATSFSCLATIDERHSFVPRWTPPFITQLAPGDRCHLNGMAVVDGAVRFVTALGTGDEPGSWRPAKATGGVLIDVPSSEIVARGLCMPHSPRWHDGELWVLQSGRGELCRVDASTGEVETVVQLPGFTRGLTFAGRMAFVGLSQIRESSTFGDLPLVHRLAERECGVWMVDLDRGEVAGFLRFDDLVQEVFDVALLHGQRYPEIAEPGSPATALSFDLP